MSFEYSKELEFACSLMATCAQITRRVQDRHLDLAQTKADHSPVTIADYAVQAVIAHALQQSFPEDGLIGEESGGVLQSNAEILTAVVDQVQCVNPKTNAQQLIDWMDHGRGSTSSRYWILDPVDGTKGFLRRMQYVTALAFMVDHEVMLSVIGCPQLTLFDNQGGYAFAARGQGAFWQSYDSTQSCVRLQVSSQRDITRATLLRSYEDSHTNSGWIERFMTSAEINTAPIEMDSQAKYVLLAAGKAELLLRLPPDNRPDFRENIWDQAPAYCLVKEAGGEMTDRLGCSLDFSTGSTLTKNTGIIASNGNLHAQTLDILEQSAS